MMRMAIRLAIAVTACALALAACGGQSGPAPGQLSLGMVTDTGGLGDNAFNDSAHKGLVRAQDQLGASVTVLESKSASDYTPNLQKLTDQHVDMIYGIGYLMNKDLQTVAHANPKQYYAIIDAVVPQPNVVSVTFKEQDGSFLAGALAAMVSKTHHVAFMGGQEIPVMQRFEDGFIAGVHQIDPSAKVDVQYAGSFEDAAAGKKIADAEYASGADIIYTAAGKAGSGAIDSVKAQPNGKYVIGVDTNQDQMAPGKVLTSMMKHVDVAVYDIAKAIKDHHPLTGHVVLGLQDQAISLTDFHYTWSVVGPEKMARLNRLQTAIVNGQIKVPDSRVALAHWKRSEF